MLKARRADRTRVSDPSKRRAPKQERELAAKIGGKTTAASGSQSEKGDVRLKGVVRIEAKCTRRRSYGLSLDTFEKIENAATLCSQNEIPAMHIEFLSPEGQTLKALAVIRADDLEDLIRRAQR